jgi:2',3'-cyclic-nucleotide 2'-phosphodiesterase (5'-nucleotidase family)
MRSLSVLSLAVAAFADEPLSDNIIQPQQQKEAFNTTEIPRAPLPWGRVNFLHTSDTHGWLDGHANVPSWGADWGDFVSFVAHMKEKALRMKVDLLLIDSGERDILHANLLLFVYFQENHAC